MGRRALTLCLGLVLTAALVDPGVVLAAQDSKRIGVTSAVQPRAEGQAPGGAATVLRIGVDVVANERVTTSAGGKVQLVFVDGTALTVGPNSDVVLDEFVYDPETKDGKLSFAATKGVFRLVGGKLSKKTPVTIKFPTATMGIRGGIAMVQGGETVTGIFVYGEEMTMSSGGQTQSVNRPGFQINVPSAGGPPSNPTPASTQQLGDTLEQLEADPQANAQDNGGQQSGGQQAGQQAGGNSGNSGNQGGGNQNGGDQNGGNPSVSDEDVSGSQISELGSNRGPGTQGPPPAPRRTTNVQTITVVTSQQRHLDSPVQESVSTQTPNEIAGNTTGSCTGLCLNGFKGRSKRGTSNSTGTNDTTASDNVALTTISIGNGEFESNPSVGAFDLFFPATTGSFSIGNGNTPASTPYGTVTGTGTLTSDKEFVVYELQGASRIFAFAGVPTTTFPSSGVTTYDFGRDFGRASDLPFLDHIAADAHGDAFIFWDQPTSGVLPAFGGGTITISGQGSSQTSAWSALFGRVRPDGSSGRHVQGSVRGQGLYSATSPARRFFGDIASSDAGDGADFFGGTAPSHLFLESALVDNNDVVQSRGITRTTQTASSTIFSNAPAYSGNNSYSSSTRTAGSHVTSGFASGVALRFNSSSITSSAVLRNRNNNPNDVRITTNADQSTVSGTFRLDDIATGDDYDLFFGESTQGGRSAFINDKVFFAGESATASTITGRVLASAAKLGLATRSVLQTSGFLPSGVSFCSCQHLSWGVFGADFDISGGSSEQIHLATWVQGDLTSFASFPTSGTAQYQGHVIASIVNSGSQYVAAGGMTLDFAFAAGSFQLTNVQINSLDGTNYTTTAGALGSFGANRYNSTSANLTIQGTKTGVGTVTALVAGAFFGSGTGAPPETGGTVTLSGSNYKGGGTYATVKQ